MPVTCEGSRGLLPALEVIPLSAASSPKSKLLLGPPGGGGGDGGCCRSPALSPAASGRGGAEAEASERRAPPGSRPVPGRPACLSRSRLSPLRSRGIVFPSPPPPPPAGFEHATFSRLRPPRPPPPPPLPPALRLGHAKSRKAGGRAGGRGRRRKAAPQRRGSSETEDPRGRLESRAGAPPTPGCPPRGALRGALRRTRSSAARAPRGSGGCSDLTAAWIRRGPANVGSAAPTPTLLTPPGDVYSNEFAGSPPRLPRSSSPLVPRALARSPPLALFLSLPG